MKFFSNLFGLNKDTTTQVNYTNQKEVLAKKEYPIVSTADTKSVGEILRLIKLVRRGRYLSTTEDDKLKTMSTMITDERTPSSHSFRLKVISRLSNSVYALYHYDHDGALIREVTLTMPH